MKNPQAASSSSASTTDSASQNEAFSFESQVLPWLEMALSYLAREGVDRLKDEAAHAGAVAVDGLRKITIVAVLLIGCLFVVALSFFSLLALAAIAWSGGPLAEALVTPGSPILWVAGLTFTLSGGFFFIGTRQKYWLRVSGLDRWSRQPASRPADPVDWDRLARVVESVVEKKLDEKKRSSEQPRD